MDSNIQAVHHVCIIVEEVERSAQFYRDVIGLDFVSDYTNSGPVADETLGLPGASQRICLLRAGSDQTLVELCQYYSPPGRPQMPHIRENDIGVRHLCFQVGDIQAVYRRLRNLGVEFTSGPVIQANGAACVFFRDPDGNSLEFVQTAAK